MLRLVDGIKDVKVGDVIIMPTPWSDATVHHLKITHLTEDDCVIGITGIVSNGAVSYDNGQTYKINLEILKKSYKL